LFGIRFNVSAVSVISTLCLHDALPIWDRLIRRLHEPYPVYGFDTNKGYVTAAHRRALARYGPCLEHRFSFVTVARVTHGARNQGPCPWTGQDEDMHENEVGAGAV